jgi:hypothetical protein
MDLPPQKGSALDTRRKELINAVRVQQLDVDDAILQELATFANVVWSAWWGLGQSVGEGASADVVTRRRPPCSTEQAICLADHLGGGY